MAGRKRSETSRVAILEATLAALRTKGYSAMSIESIARLAGVGKQTIYRWWETKGDLVLEALRYDAGQTIAEQQSADYRHNLECFLASSFKRLSEPDSGNTLRWLMAQAQLEPDFQARFRDDFIRVRREALRRVLQLDREDALSAEEEDFLMDVTFGVMWYRLLVGHGALDVALAERLATLVAQERERLLMERAVSKP